MIWSVYYLLESGPQFVDWSFVESVKEVANKSSLLLMYIIVAYYYYYYYLTLS